MRRRKYAIELGGSREGGDFVVVEGPSGAGKSTLVEALGEQLPFDSWTTRFPTSEFRCSETYKRFSENSTPSAEELLAIQVHYAADRLSNCLLNVIPRLGECQTVIADRYVYSSVSTLLAYGLGTPQWLRELSSPLPPPTVGVYLYAERDVIRERLERRKDGASGVARRSFFERGQEIAMRVARDNGMIVLDTGRCDVDECVGKVTSLLGRGEGCE